ncbi:MAG: 30S ribosomal protein S6 [Bacilli bacterium]
MKKYEISFIVSPNLDGEQVKSTVENFKGVLTGKGAEVVKTDDLGLKTLAYEINDFNKGHYFVLEVNSTEEANLEFDRLAKINENILRHIIINL